MWVVTDTRRHNIMQGRQSFITVRRLLCITAQRQLFLLVIRIMDAKITDIIHIVLIIAGATIIIGVTEAITAIVVTVITAVTANLAAGLDICLLTCLN